jgi:hypothetical protein
VSVTHEVKSSTLQLLNYLKRRLPDESSVQSQTYVTTSGQSASLSWCRAPIWGLRPDFYCCQTVASVLMWDALSDERMVCRLQLLLVLATAVILGSESRGTRDHILLSQIRDFPVLVSPRNREALLYHRVPLFIVFYDAQDYSGGIWTRIHAGWILCYKLSASYIGSAPSTHRKHINCSASDILYCCQACPPMHCLAMDTLLVHMRCCEMCLPVCYLVMDAVLLDVRWLKHVYVFVSKKRPNLSRYIGSTADPDCEVY